MSSPAKEEQASSSGAKAALSSRGYVGMEVTKQPPFTVLEVDNLMDEHYILQGHAGYSNEHVKRGDKLLRVDGTRVESVTVKHLHELLGGDKHSLAELSFARAQGGEEYTIRVRRHGRHEHERKPPDANGSITQVEDTGAPLCGASAHKTLILPAVPPSSSVSSKVSSKVAQTQMAPIAVSEEAGDKAAAAAGAGDDVAAAAAERRPTGKRDSDPSNAQASASASAAEKEQGAMRGAGASLRHMHVGPALTAGILTYADVC
jgi:hypothetical protein